MAWMVMNISIVLPRFISRIVYISPLVQGYRLDTAWQRASPSISTISARIRHLQKALPLFEVLPPFWFLALACIFGIGVPAIFSILF